MNSTNKTEIQASYIAAALGKHITPSSHVLDLGFGNCELMKLLSSSEYHCIYTGIDSDPACVSDAQKKISELSLESMCSVKLGTDLKSVSGHFEYCVCSRLLHHLAPKVFHQTLKEMVQALKENGTLLLVDSIRDYRNRPDRFLYTPYSVLNELSELFPNHESMIQYNPACRIDVEELWLQKISFSGLKIRSIVEKIR